MCLLCKNCIDAIKSRGENVWVGKRIDFDDGEEEQKCEWCEEEDTPLYDCRF